MDKKTSKKISVFTFRVTLKREALTPSETLVST
jgi:hypothetical protein